ncbi:MAG: DUF1178 family protein [Hyphomicrobiaceae bacterium]
MIRYRLTCADAHEFEAWFSSSAAYDKQAKAGHVTCPECGSNKVEKALMAPNVATSRKKEAARTKAKATAVPARPVASQMPTEMLEMMRKIRDHVRENADYVGDKFAEEARKIHYEETEARGIYGEATPDEAKALHEEGIAVHPLPLLPEDKN